MDMTKLAWAVWAIAPVIALAYHFGPGQDSYNRDRAVDLQAEAIDAQRQATEAQATAYAAHLQALRARQKAFETQSRDDRTTANAASDVERLAYEKAAAAWQDTADLLGDVVGLLGAAPSDQAMRLRWSQCRALIRANRMWDGISGMEQLLRELKDNPALDQTLAGSVREELAAASYYAARLQRLAGEAEKDWRQECTKARQHFRYLAEQSRKGGLPQNITRGYERNLELVLNLEQSGPHELVGTPLPRESPKGNPGCRKCRGKKPGKRPDEDARGAGTATDMGAGW